jgi:hypothetical protein
MFLLVRQYYFSALHCLNYGWIVDDDDDDDAVVGLSLLIWAEYM